MGYSYVNGKLACDVCGHTPARKKKCPFGWCNPAALCPSCMKDYNKGGAKHANWIQFHKDCESQAKASRERHEREKKILDEGHYTRSWAQSASNSGAGLDMLKKLEIPDLDEVGFRNKDGDTKAYYMESSTYNSIPLVEPATVWDYVENGRVWDENGIEVFRKNDAEIVMGSEDFVYRPAMTTWRQGAARHVCKGALDEYDVAVVPWTLCGENIRYFPQIWATVTDEKWKDNPEKYISCHKCLAKWKKMPMQEQMEREIVYATPAERYSSTQVPPFQNGDIVTFISNVGDSWGKMENGIYSPVRLGEEFIIGKCYPSPEAASGWKCITTTPLYHLNSKEVIKNGFDSGWFKFVERLPSEIVLATDKVPMFNVGDNVRVDMSDDFNDKSVKAWKFNPNTIITIVDRKQDDASFLYKVDPIPDGKQYGNWWDETWFVHAEIREQEIVMACREYSPREIVFATNKFQKGDKVQFDTDTKSEYDIVQKWGENIFTITEVNDNGMYYKISNNNAHDDVGIGGWWDEGWFKHPPAESEIVMGSVSSMNNNDAVIGEPVEEDAWIEDTKRIAEDLVANTKRLTKKSREFAKDIEHLRDINKDMEREKKKRTAIVVVAICSVVAVVLWAKVRAK